MNLNKAFILGRITSDVELKLTTTGTNVCSFSVATNSVYGKGDQKTENVEYHSIVVFGKQAENCASFLTKGQLLFIEGRIQTQKWEKDGITRTKTQIIAELVQFGPKSGSGGQKQAKNDYPQETYQSDDQIDIKDIPF
jgi:single-strand DNA-binding protein